MNAGDGRGAVAPAVAEMEQFYAERVCFITGATGFVGKVLVEKLLRWQPNGPPLYVLIRPRQDETADDRLRREVRNMRAPASPQSVVRGRFAGSGFGGHVPRA